MRISLTRAVLVKFKARALRRGIWYKAITRVERACLDLTIKVVNKVRSDRLKRTLSSILRKLTEAIESQVWRLMRNVGCNLALKLSQIAQNWGNESAAKWSRDLGFIRYLTITYGNKLS
jgi:5-carboxymethyl-2-hydroxymuconate isomerase